MLQKIESPTKAKKNLSEAHPWGASGFRGAHMASKTLKRLTQQRDAINARIKQEESKLRASEKKIDTRRKILAGATVLEWARRDSEFSSRLMTELRRFLVRDADRELFGLPPLANKENARAV
jgi:hypothetical protein